MLWMIFAESVVTAALSQSIVKDMVRYFLLIFIKTIH